MDPNPIPNKKPSPAAIILILAGGLLLGLSFSLIIFSEQAPANPPSPTPAGAPQFIQSTPQNFQDTAIPLQSGRITNSLAPVHFPQIGKPAPGFSLKTLTGTEITLSQLKGRPVIINLWASWCPPCKDEMPLLESVYQKEREKNLAILAIDIVSEDDLPSMQKFIDENKITFPVLLDDNGQVSRGLYGMFGRPPVISSTARGMSGASRSGKSCRKIWIPTWQIFCNDRDEGSILNIGTGLVVYHPGL